MHAPALLTDLVLTYSLALCLLVLAARIRVPTIVALMASGILAGPSALGIISSREDVELLAEVGIVLLLFTVGLEFSLPVLRKLWTTVLIGGALQMSAVTLLVTALAVGIGFSWRLGVFVGLFVALSSTAILLRELGARNQLDSPYGRLVVGVLLFQDLAVVVLLVLLPLLMGAGATESQWLTLARTAGALIVVTAVARFVLPRLLRVVAPHRTREAFSLAVFLTSMGVAWLTAQFGASMALGAFLGGLILAETEFSHRIHAEVRPIRDILASLFFISVGLLINPFALVTRLPWVLAAVAVVVLVKVAATFTSLSIIRAGLRPTLIGAVILVPIGEFSFVLGRAGVSAGFLDAQMWQVLLGASVLTMAAAPTLVSIAPAVGDRLRSVLGRAADAERVAGPMLSGHVVILGYGLGGRLLARGLRDIGVPFVVLELNARTVREAALEGIPIRYANVTSQDALEGAGLAQAHAVVAVLSDPDATRRAVRAVRQIAPSVPIIARTRYRHEADNLHRQGVTLAVAEELEASLEVLAQLLARLGVPGNALEVLVDVFRRNTTAGRAVHAPSLPMTALPEAIQRSPVATHRIEKGAWATGRTIGETGLRTSTGATILAIQAGERYVTSPTASEVLETGQVLYLLGDESDILLARALLTDGPRERHRKQPA